MTGSIAWKNIWRNKTRSLVILSAIALGLLAGIFSVAMMAGMVNERIENAIQNELSHLQIHNKEFLQNDEIRYTIPETNKIIKTLDTIPEVKATAARLRMNGMANTSGNNTGVIILGVHPEQEKSVFNIHENILENTGNFFEEESRNQIVIGEKLAHTLNLVHYEITEEAIEKLKEAGVPEKVTNKVKNAGDSLMNIRFRDEDSFRQALQKVLTEAETDDYYSSWKEAAKLFRTRSKIVLTMQDNEGYITGGAFRIAGIYNITNSVYEGMNVFVRYDDLQRITNINNGNAHEIAVLLDDREAATGISKMLEEEFSGLSVRLWKEIQPDLALTTEYIEISYYIIIIFILLALGFGIVNTMLMAVLERIKELGMLMAIGMNKIRIFMMIMLETLFLTITGAIVGMLLSLGVIAITRQTGIDLSHYAEGFQALGYSAVVYPGIDISFFAGVTLLVILTGIVSSLYPAYKALKLNPVEATRTE